MLNFVIEASIPDQRSGGNVGIGTSVPGYNDTTDHIGIIAQELEPVAVKEQQAEIEALKKQNADLAAALQEIKAELDALKAGPEATR